MPDKNPFSASSAEEEEREPEKLAEAVVKIYDDDEDENFPKIPISITSKGDVNLTNGLNLETEMKMKLEKKRMGRQEKANKNKELIRKLEEDLGVIAKKEPELESKPEVIFMIFNTDAVSLAIFLEPYILETKLKKKLWYFYE
jgi:hypothetical protein